MAAAAKAPRPSMRILFFTENFPPEMNAAATRVFERACYWVKWGHDVTIVTCHPNFPQGRLFDGHDNRWHTTETMAGMRVVRVKTYISANTGVAKRILDFTSFMATGYVASLFEHRPDVIVSTSPQFFCAVAGWASSTSRRVPFVFELGDLWPASIVAVGAMKQSIALRGVEQLELFLYRQSAAVVALTRSFKDDLVGRRIDPDKIAVVINGVDLPRYAPRPRDAELASRWGLEGKFVVGYIGTHGSAHGLHNVLEAAERTRDDDRLRYMFVGTGAERQALELAASERRLDNIVFIPPQPKESMPRFWSLCDVALIHLKDDPVFQTVIPSKMFEAMGMGLPLLLSAPVGEASRIVEDDGAGLCVPAGAPDALADAALQLMSDAALHRRLCEQSHAAASKHTRERQAQEMIDVLGQVVAAGPVPTALR